VDLGRRQVIRIGRFALYGLDGAEDAPDEVSLGSLLRRPENVRTMLERSHRAAGDATTHVVVAHSPPRGVLDAAVRWSPDGEPRPIGSRGLRQFIRAHPEVRLVCCGHCHRMGGRTAPFRQALVVNAASHDDRGARTRVAEVVLGHTGTPRVRWHKLRLAPGFERLELGPTRNAALRRAGIADTRALARTHPTRISAAIGYSPRACVPIVAIARALVRGTPVVHSDGLPAYPRVLLDIETDLRQRAIWMVGLLDEATGEFRQLVARREQDEPGMLRTLADLVTGCGRTVVTWSGSRYDERVLCQAYGRHGLVPPEPLIAAEDAFFLVRKCIALPVDDHGLKAVAAWCGFRFRHPDLDGFTVGALCARHRTRGTPPPPAVRQYNEDDVRALGAVLRRCDRLLARGLSVPAAWMRLPGPRRAPKVTRRPLWPLTAPRLVAASRDYDPSDAGQLRITLRRADGTREMVLLDPVQDSIGTAPAGSRTPAT
jgi:hypothetical protein